MFVLRRNLKLSIGLRRMCEWVLVLRYGSAITWRPAQGVTPPLPRDSWDGLPSASATSARPAEAIKVELKAASQFIRCLQMPCQYFQQP